MVHCAAINCTQNQSTATKDVSFHRFPTDKSLRAIWVQNIRRKNFKPTRTSYLCSKHFDEDSYRPSLFIHKRRGLKKLAVPTLFDLPQRLLPKQPRPRPPPRVRNVDERPVGLNPEASTEVITPNLDHIGYCLKKPRHAIQDREALLAQIEKQGNLIKKLQNSNCQKSKTIRNIRASLNTLEKKNIISQSGCEHLETFLTPTLMQLFEQIKRNKDGHLSRKRFPEELKAFAITLQFYSTKAYDYVRKTFLKALPHVSTIRNWYSTMDGGPGFSEPGFELLRLKVEEERKYGKRVILALMVDDMSIRKQVEYIDKERRFKGYVDVGSNNGELQDISLATEAMVIMVVAMNSHWKLPLGHFFIAGMSAPERANLIRLALQKAHDVGSWIVSFTCDGPSTHIAMLRDLGATMNPDNPVPHFIHPSDPSLRVHVFLDLVHMIKLVRNCFGREKVLISSSGVVNWIYIEHLHRLQETEGLRAGTKLRKTHMNWNKMKMKVKYATQTLSSSVADAIDFCREDLRLPQFEGSKATTEFIRLFDALFDIFNSQNILCKRFKIPLRPETEYKWQPLLSEAFIYIQNLKLKNGHPIMDSRQKTGFQGFACGIVALHNLYEDVVLAGHMKYILTHKFGQDHLELFFCAIRSGLGSGNNPTCRQFDAAMKRLITQQDIKGFNGNVTEQDSTQMLMLTSSVPRKEENTELNKGIIGEFELSQENVNLDIFCQGLSKFKESVVTYVSGYVVRMVEKKTKCRDCLQALICEEDSASQLSWYSLTLRKKWGSLILPSHDVIQVCFETERVLQGLLRNSESFLSNHSNCVLKVEILVLKKVFFREN